jgi:hypothetical protein
MTKRVSKFRKQNTGGEILLAWHLPLQKPVAWRLRSRVSRDGKREVAEIQRKTNWNNKPANQNDQFVKINVTPKNQP